MIIYIDSDCKNHATEAEGLRAFEEKPAELQDMQSVFEEDKRYSGLLADE